jgi:hypothetical protein
MFKAVSVQPSGCCSCPPTQKKRLTKVFALQYECRELYFDYGSALTRSVLE